MQSSVSSEPVAAYPGKVHTRLDNMSALASEIIRFGKGVSQTKTDVGSLPPSVQGYTSGEVFVGVAEADPTIERSSDSYGQYPALDAVPVLKKGRIWVDSGDTVDDLSKDVFIRNANDAGTAASVTDTTSYAVADQDTLALTINIISTARSEFNLGAQTITFDGTVTSALHVAAGINDQLKQGHATVTGGQVVITSDELGAGVSIVVDAGDTDLTFDTPVAGTGASDTRGGFRATTATGYTNLSSIANVKWVDGRTIGGVYYGLLAINEG